jgi:16S rRNA (adenine1518-N6/adenine1519-N6)-dimethyltransferase
LQKHKFKKQFGQNFLRDSRYAKDIIDLSNIDQYTHVLEIGPGLGYLTKFLLNTAQKVTSVEIDYQLIPKLITRFKNEENFNLINEDIQNLNIHEIFEEGETVSIVGSLPFNISKLIIRKCIDFGIETELNIKPFTFIVQEEVAKLFLTRNNKLGIIYQYYCNIKKGKSIQSTNFTPTPKVNGAIISFTIIKKKKNENFEKIVNLALKSPRKTLINNLKKSHDITSLKSIFSNLNLSQKIRSSDLSVKDWENLTKELTALNRY